MLEKNKLFSDFIRIAPHKYLDQVHEIPKVGCFNKIKIEVQHLFAYKYLLTLK